MTDKYVDNILKRWNMSFLIPIFEDKKINAVAFNQLDSVTIAELVPSKRLRKRFLSKYNLYKTYTNGIVTDEVTLSEIEDATTENIDLTSEDNEEHPQLKSELQSSSFDIEFILQESPFGKQVISNYNKMGHLDYDHSMSLSNILIDFLITQSADYTIDNDVLDEIADAIIFRFPNERKDAYYEFSGKNPRGNLVECYYNVRKKLIRQEQSRKKLNSADISSGIIDKKLKTSHLEIDPPRESQAPMPEWVEVEGTANEEMVNIKWDPHRNSFLQSLPQLLEDEKFVDVTIICEGVTIRCHKIVLSSYSVNFEKMLSSSPCKHPVIFLADIKFWEIQALIDFMYTGELNIEESKLPQLFEVATKLNVKGLANIDIDGNEQNVETENVSQAEAEDPLSVYPSVSKRENSSSLQRLLNPTLSQSDKLFASKKDKHFQDSKNSKVNKGSNNCKQYPRTNPNQRRITQNAVRTLLLPRTSGLPPKRRPCKHVLVRNDERYRDGSRKRKVCRVCFKESGNQKKSVFVCSGCPERPGLCSPRCFHVYHIDL